MIATDKIEDPEGLINTLQARVKQLERQLQNELEYHAQPRPGEFANAIKSLRLHGLILLHVGDQDGQQLQEQLAQHPQLREVIDVVWPLSSAPVAPGVREALKVASNRGNTRW